MRISTSLPEFSSPREYEPKTHALSTGFVLKYSLIVFLTFASILLKLFFFAKLQNFFKFQPDFIKFFKNSLQFNNILYICRWIWQNHFRFIEKLEALCSSKSWKRRKFHNEYKGWHSDTHVMRGPLYSICVFGLSYDLQQKMWYTVPRFFYYLHYWAL